MLPEIYGVPQRLMVQGLKVIEHIEFSPLELRGYRPGAGPYTTSGTIEGGRDRPLDVSGTRQIEGGWRRDLFARMGPSLGRRATTEK